MTESYRLVSDAQWRNLHRKMNYLTDSVAEMKRELKEMRRPKRGLTFSECLPPASVCRDVVSMLIGDSSYSGFVNRLAGFYECEPMGVYRDENVDEKYLAVYRAQERACYSRGPTIARETVLHEFFHHLIAQCVVSVKKDQEEDYAAKYSAAFMRRVMEGTP